MIAAEGAIYFYEWVISLIKTAVILVCEAYLLYMLSHAKSTAQLCWFFGLNIAILRLPTMLSFGNKP